MIYVVGFLFSLDCTCVSGCPRVALIKKNRPDWQKGRLNGIGGKVEPGELSDEAMRREFREEAGEDFIDWRLFMVQQGVSETLYFYVGLARHDTLRRLRSVTDEEVGVYYFNDIVQVVDRRPDMVPNLPWELSLAYLALCSDTPVLHVSFQQP